MDIMNQFWLCKFIIANAWIEKLTGEGEVPVFGFLIDMGRLFEDFLTKLVQEAYPNYDVASQDRVNNLVRKPASVTGMILSQEKIPDIILKPDVILRSKGRNLLVVDAKYKHKISNNDLYQAVAYSLTLGAPTVLVLPEDLVEMTGAYEIVEQVDSRVYVITLGLKAETADFETTAKREIVLKLGPIIAQNQD
jgi:5-methylcytosine-specific restriction endonuclease McrBC regulatory subunit McrC